MIDQFAYGIAFAATVYIGLIFWGRFKWFGQQDLATLFSELERINRDKRIRMVYRFADSSYWLLLEREPTSDGVHYSLCIPRPGFSSDDYRKLQSQFVEHGFTFDWGDEMARFAARVPLERGQDAVEPRVNASTAVRVFIRALGMAPNAKFRRSFDVDI